MTPKPGDPPSPGSLSPAAGRVLLALAVAGLAGTLVCAWGWLAARREPSVGALSAEQRQALVQEMLADSPGLYRWAFFEPRIGYTLRPRARLSAWGDTFQANELGYRTHPPAKAPGTLRVLFVGDSWTFGMGVKQQEAFAEVFAAEANAHSGERRRVESWVLGLPGYNLLNELSALWFFFGRLEPDLVVLCPSGNDNHSTLQVLPNGSTTEQGGQTDDFGDPHVVAYHLRRLTSHRYRDRWRASFDAVRRSEQQLASLDVPLLLFFVGRWHEDDAHAAIAGSGIRSPYVIVPIELTKGQWRNRHHGHGTPAANRLYGQMVYRGVAHLLGWPELPAADPLAAVPVHVGAPAGTDWTTRQRELSRAVSREVIRTSFRPAERGARQAVGPLHGATGLMGRATTVLVRREAGSPRLAITVRGLPEAPYLYPMALTVAIPSPAGGTRLVTTVPRGNDLHRFTIDVPPDLAPDAVLDVTFVAERTTAAPDVLAARSLFIEAIDNQP